MHRHIPLMLTQHHLQEWQHFTVFIGSMNVRPTGIKLMVKFPKKLKIIKSSQHGYFQWQLLANRWRNNWKDFRDLVIHHIMNRCIQRHSNIVLHLVHKVHVDSISTLSCFFTSEKDTIYYFKITSIILSVKDIQVVFVSHPVTKSIACPEFTWKWETRC